MTQMNKTVLPIKPSYNPQTVIIEDKRELYRCYMPFIKGGGLFIPFNDEITALKIYPGQVILVVLYWLDNKYPINGTVVWISRNSPHKGFGIKFGEGPGNKMLKAEIEATVLEYNNRKESNYTI